MKKQKTMSKGVTVSRVDFDFDCETETETKKLYLKQIFYFWNQIPIVSLLNVKRGRYECIRTYFFV